MFCGGLKGYVVALDHVTKTMTGATCQPLVVILLMSGWYFIVFLSKVHATNLSLQYENSILCLCVPVWGLSGERGYMGGL